ncbi:NACHT domain-containing protein [Novosphingobium sp. ZW T3_23]|uniref:NACHT domain-containing protein n=1 Tax=Novosphingobium sp. ZW T3_23 TaxID=3378084 RepID=UPI003853ED7A
MLPPHTELTALAMEGLSIEDEQELSAPAIEIADLTRYYGGRNLLQAKRVEVVQFKYSTARATVPVRATDLSPTLMKFAQGEAERRGRHGDVVADRVSYEYATNRPIHPELDQAIAALGSGTLAPSSATGQAAQIVAALAGYNIDLPAFLRRLALLGRLGDLTQARRGLARTLASWSAPGDTQTRLRLRELEHLVREKAGLAGLRDKLIDRVAVLDELKVDHENDLYPAPDVFPPVATRIERKVLDEIVATTRSARLPLVVHGEGGMGKTVLMQALAERLSTTHAVVLFDGYGAGNWRDPSNPRHLASRTLVHLANLLAAQGLSDLLLPTHQEDGLLRAFRLRLADAVTGIRQRAAAAGVALVLDAIDHAALAVQPGQRSFAQLLLHSLSVDPIDGVLVVASCRTERRDQAVGGAEHDDFRIPAFSEAEVAALVLARDAHATPVDIAALTTRSGANPRCLDAFLTVGRPYENHAAIEGDPHKILDTLIEERITEARREAMRRGASAQAVDALLAGLAMLPPPVPAIELAAAQGLSASDIESFAADLAPLLERTRHGLMFRDEPTETLIIKMAQADAVARDAVIARLTDQQSRSSYAARALPMVLAQAGRVEALTELAFSATVPAGTSDIGRREIRIARITAALHACAHAGRSDDILRLALEASLVAAGHERADRFLYEHPDLTAIAGDPEALRRLFATRTGNPQGRHSALAIAYALAGERGEAERHAERAIDWFNHGFRKEGPHYGSGGPSRRFDAAGFAYVRLLADDTRRMFDWLGRNSDAFAYNIVSRVLDLGDCHTAGGIDPPGMAILRRRLSGCPSALPGAAAAALSRSNGDAALDRRFVAQLAAPPRPTPEDGEEASAHQESLPVEALLQAALRAADLKCRKEARTIFARFEARTRTAYSFDDYRGKDLDPVFALVAAGVAGPLARREPALIDLAPSELLELVPPSIRKRGPAGFAVELEKRIKGQGQRRSRRKTKRREEDGWRQERLDQQRKLVDHRLKPILPYAVRIAGMIKAAPSARRALVAEWVEAIESDVRGARNYEFRDERSYLARMGGLALIFTGTTLGALDGPLAERIAALLIAAKHVPPAPLLWACERLSRIPGAQVAIMQLARHIEAAIRSGTDTTAKLTDYGKLARAVWRTSPHDAAALFRKALDLAEAMGSDDFQRANSVLQLAGNYRGAPLADAASYALPRIFELQLGDDDRYPWGEWADAMRGTAGTVALAMLSRLDERSAAQLSLTLPPMLTALVEDGNLPADIALALIGIGGAGECRDFGLDRFARAALPQIDTASQRILFDYLLVEIDREDGLTPYGRTIAGLTRLAGERFDPEDPIRTRLAALARPYRDDDAPPYGRAETDATVGEMVLDADTIDAAIAQDTMAHDGHRFPERVLLQLAARAKDTGSRLRLLHALIDVDAPLDDKLQAVEAHLDAWAALSPAISEALPAIGDRLARRHPDDLASTSWDTIRCWRILERKFGLDRGRIAHAAVIGFDAGALDVAGDAWLSLAAELAPATSQPALRQGLERFLTLVDRDLPEEIGDGTWQAGFAAPQEAVEAAAGLIWIRLGNPSAGMRWRAAHAVVRLAALGRRDVIDALIARFDKDAGPFAAPAIPFHRMDAQLFLLLALGRIARETPDLLLDHQSLFDGVVANDKFPHAALQEAAVKVLRGLLPALSGDRAKMLEARLVKANRSPFPPVARDNFHADAHGMRPEGTKPPRREIYLDYDFNKFHIARLIRMFRLEAWQIEDRITAWVRRSDTTLDSMFSDPRPHHSGDRSDSWSGGYIPEKFRYGGYLVWHGLQLAAGELMRQRACTEPAWTGDSDSWREFLADAGISRVDGAWLAEWSDLTPIDAGAEMPMPSRDHGRFYDPASERLLAPLIGLDSGRAELAVAGNWETSGDIDLSVVTIFAPERIARAALYAGLLTEAFHQGLPIQDDEREDEFGNSARKIRGWIEQDNISDRELDRFDPYAALTAQGRPRPARWLQTAEALVRADPAGRLWTQAGQPILRGEAWGGPDGRLDRKGDRGERLWANRNWLAQHLRASDMTLAGMVKARSYTKRDRDDVEGGFHHRSLGFLIDSQGRTIIPKRVPAAVRAAVAGLGQYERYDFAQRFRVILKVLNA